jgi:putative sterol carrier protein
VAAREFFEGLEARADASKIAGIDHTYLFEVQGEGEWLVAVMNGMVQVTEGSAKADATITVSSEVFDKIADGTQSPTLAYMTGKLKIRGDIAAALKLQKIF